MFHSPTMIGQINKTMVIIYLKEIKERQREYIMETGFILLLKTNANKVWE